MQKEVLENNLVLQNKLYLEQKANKMKEEELLEMKKRSEDIRKQL